MKQADDTATGDLLEGFKRPVGRPRTGKALSAAERQRRSRERKKALGASNISVSAVDAECVQALRKFVEYKDLSQGEALSRILRDRLLRKR